VILQETCKTSILEAYWEQLNSGSTFRDFIEVDSGVLTCEQQTIYDVLDQHVNHASERDAVSDEEDEYEQVPVPSHL
jgi:hypothetical protein